MLPFWRLDPPFRFAVYIAFAVLFASGAAAWLIADRIKETNSYCVRAYHAFALSGACQDRAFAFIAARPA